ncbi:Serine/threonine-protein kinase ksp1 [Neolecta irregularis DAH-3]|uniref:Serine/threonine-protein kinase ksp1 n=1 Tax=Neolecta irregularis (strain DAH-3) TaxID=1198029 RepID=A0A1U7LHX2_NEOID|nr:Serine/threonine-protein kinase ksp1 [Neolecta irregularis DAH-3]|eukprot:OLL22256.1 Serine/threonine-protein kinase ksp1 [Neolecta irregularis DAH-3]
MSKVQDIPIGTVLKGRYQVINTLNRGSFGLVILARDLRLNFADDWKNLVAIKCVSKDEPLSRELKILQRLESKHVVRFNESFDNRTTRFIVMEYCPLGDLYEAISTDRAPKETESIRNLMLQVIDAIMYCHKMRVYHRDVKPENLLLSVKPEGGVKVKLADFGLATLNEASDEIGCGSDRYMAPEQFDGLEYSAEKADIWSVGIVLLNVVFGKNIFKSPDMSDPIFADFARDPISLMDALPSMTEDTYNVLRHALQLDPSKRSLSAMREAVLHVVEWTNDFEVFEESDDYRRISISEADNFVYVLATKNRQPLRTPSVQSAAFSAFPWQSRLAAQPQKIQSAGPTNEHLFNRMETMPEDDADSALGASIGHSFTPMKIQKARKVNLGSSSSYQPARSHMKFGVSWSDLTEDEETMSKSVGCVGTGLGRPRALSSSESSELGELFDDGDDDFWNALPVWEDSA